MLFCSNSAHFSEIQLVCDTWTDGRKDGRTDGRTDAPSYRDARTHLKGIIYNFTSCPLLFVSNVLRLFSSLHHLTVVPGRRDRNYWVHTDVEFAQSYPPFGFGQNTNLNTCDTHDDGITIRGAINSANAWDDIRANSTPRRIALICEYS